MSLNAARAQVGTRFSHEDSLVIANIANAHGEWVDLNNDGQFDFLASLTD